MNERRCKWFIFGKYLIVVAVACAGCASKGGSVSSSKRNVLLPETTVMLQQAPWPQPLPRELAKQLLPAYTIEVGDQLQIVQRDEDAGVKPTDVAQVMPDGTIDLGKFGQIVAAGQTPSQLADAIEKAIAAKEKKVGDIDVRLMQPPTLSVYVLGEVTEPGIIKITGRETVLDAILAAKGLTKSASRTNIVLSRPTPACDCRKVYQICYDQIVQLGDTSTNYQVMPGDRIFVARAGMKETCPLFNKKKVCSACDEPQRLCPPLGPTCPKTCPVEVCSPTP